MAIGKRNIGRSNTHKIFSRNMMRFSGFYFIETHYRNYFLDKMTWSSQLTYFLNTFLLTCMTTVSSADANTLANNVTNATEFFDRIPELLHLPSGFISALIVSLAVVLISELGDKSFFIAALMAMQRSRVIVFTAALLALEIMTLISILLGNIITKFVPRIYIFYGSLVLFAIFGFKMLYEAYYMENNIELSQDEMTDLQRNDINSIFQLFFEVFTMIFLAEWGDRSQISILVLGARKDIMGTLIGCTLGNVICTGVAVLGGRFNTKSNKIK